MSEVLAELKTLCEGFEAKNKALQRRVDEIDVMMKRPGGGPSEDSGSGSGWCGDLARKLFENSGVEAFRKARFAGHIQLKLDGAALPLQTKTVIDSAAVGSSTPGILSAQREPGIIALPRRRLTVRDLIGAKPCTASMVDYIKENAFTNAASPQTESSDKAQSADTFVIASANVRTIAHWIPASRQVLDDVAELERFLRENLMYGLKLKEETEILSGDNLGNHLNGIITQASSYAGTYDVSGDTKLDRLRHAIMELEAGDQTCTAMILNPVDVGRIDLIKTEEGGANKGMYIVGDPLGSGTVMVPSLWGRPVVASNSITAGKFLVGDFTKAKLYDRLDAVIDISTEHSDYFIKNLVAIRCEERVALAVYRPSAFLYGNLP